MKIQRNLRLNLGLNSLKKSNSQRNGVRKMNTVANCNENQRANSKNKNNYYLEEEKVNNFENQNYKSYEPEPQLDEDEKLKLEARALIEKTKNMMKDLSLKKAANKKSISSRSTVNSISNLNDPNLNNFYNNNMNYEVINKDNLPQQLFAKNKQIKQLEKELKDKTQQLKVAQQKLQSKNDEIVKLITSLKENGINAISKQDEKAQNPSSVVVMNNGIMTPFMDKKTADSLMPKIKEVMSGCGFSVGGHISPITFEQLRSPFETEQDPKNTPFMHDFIANFSKKEGVELKDFTQLMTSNEKIKIDLDKFALLSEESDNNGRPYLWRGGALGDKAFIANIDTENSQGHVLRKSWAMATPLAEYARGYAGLADRDASSDYTISFLYQ